MNSLTKKYIIGIPYNTTVFYCKNKNIITIIGPIKKKSLKIRLKLLILKKTNEIYITNTLTELNLKNNSKKIKALRGTTTALIKQLLVETSNVIYKKLNFVGIGYKTFEVENFKNSLIMLKLGFSHPIYFKIPTNLKFFSIKQTKLFIYGFSTQNVSQTAALVQSFKLPEPYKGKGILYENVKVILKEGKKT